MATSLSDEQVDAAIHEYLVRVGQRRPVGRDDYRWAAEGKRRVRDLDTLRDWIGHDGSRAVGDKAGGARG